MASTGVRENVEDRRPHPDNLALFLDIPDSPLSLSGTSSPPTNNASVCAEVIHPTYCEQATL